MTILITVLLALLLAAVLIGATHLGIEFAPPIIGVAVIVFIVLALFVALAVQRLGGLP